jgi:hypothetical protein
MGPWTVGARTGGIAAAKLMPRDFPLSMQITAWSSRVVDGACEFGRWPHPPFPQPHNHLLARSPAHSRQG